MSKIVSENSVITTHHYQSGYQYENGNLQFFPHAKGYVKYSNNQYGYVYNYTDHLGNNRLSYSDTDKNGILGDEEIVSCGPPNRYGFSNCTSYFTSSILEENHYYPFGLEHEGYGIGRLQKYKYKYNGKEYQDELGLNMYDYGARNYDPALGRWMNIDPLAEKYSSLSPYNYVMNNPVFFIDPDGMRVVSFGNTPPGEIRATKTTTAYLSAGKVGKGVNVIAPNGKTHHFDSKVQTYTYSDGKTHNDQQKKEGVWSITTKDGNWMWNNVKGEYVLNTSDRGGAENSVPKIGKMGTTYAGGDNPKNALTGDDDYSQPPQNIADFAGLVHDKAYDKLGLIGGGGVLSPKSTGANNDLISFSNQIVSMYNQKMIDPFTGAPVSKATMLAALNMSRAFTIIEQAKK